MTHVLVQALRSFEYGGVIKSRKSEPFPIRESEFEQLKARKLVQLAADEPPKPPAGTPSSASPAAPVSPPPTVTPPAAGVPKKGRKPKGSSA
ncbi:hypothetical protein [Pseudomonas sp. PDM13]|uniref:hypothetical protein n=1 Tax=Pseudomonas sp. PDM13 TaxID=2769255 RepID=UPI0021E0537D|nr:hypothetical protein [Pseudomonas sp. PDM13]MCU9947506.1 hypothetical protein [Pseudomonas sp. PDM13]